MNRTVLKFLFPVLVLIGLIGLSALPRPPVQAQGEPKDTPTTLPQEENGRDSGSHNDEGDDDDDSTPVPRPAGVSGFVYNDGLVPQGGVLVTLEGGGWRAETVTDSNGFYQFGGLGRGQGRLNLVLPPDKHPILPDWPVTPSSSVNEPVNLGYYSGDAPNLPVLLSGELLGESLILEVTNRSADTASGGLIEVQLPVGIRSTGSIQTSQGIIRRGVNGLGLETGKIEPGTTVTMQARLAEQPKVTAPPLDQAGLRAVFTYDQQLLPQLVTLPAAQFTPVTGPAAIEMNHSDSMLPTTGHPLKKIEGWSWLLPALVVLVLSLAGWKAVKSRL